MSLVKGKTKKQGKYWPIYLPEVDIPTQGKGSPQDAVDMVFDWVEGMSGIPVMGNFTINHTSTIDGKEYADVIIAFMPKDPARAEDLTAFFNARLASKEETERREHDFWKTN